MIGSRSRKHGLTLLEVLLSLAILGGAMVTIGELMRIGARNAEIARDQTTAQLIAETKMAELEVGFLPLQSLTTTAVEDLEYQSDWLYTVTVEPVDQAGLVSVFVTVDQNSDLYSRPISFTLARWMIDETMLPTTDGTTTAAGG